MAAGVQTHARAPLRLRTCLASEEGDRICSTSRPPLPFPSCCRLLGQPDFALLYFTNLSEFFGTTLSRLSALQWLYETTGDARVLAALGAVTLLCQIPSIALGGVLADSIRRTTLVSTVQSFAALIATVRWLLCSSDVLSVSHVYVTVALLEICCRIEASARASITPACVKPAELPQAISLLMITQYAGEIVAPFFFWLLADAGGKLTFSFAAAALSFLICAVLPRLISADTLPVQADAESPAHASSDRGCGAPALRRAWLVGLGRMVQGLKYILHHPLLPGLYALDWGFTCVSFYRELFPLWVGVWLTSGLPAGLSSRGAVAVCVASNFSGAMCGSCATLVLNKYPYKGRLVVAATSCYGLACFAFGCTQQFVMGAVAIFSMGACDAVGATMRKQVVLLTTPDNLRGRAQSGHQMAAYVANSIGQLYVGFMVGHFGAGITMKIGGVVTELMTLLAIYCIPALVTYQACTPQSRTITPADDDTAPDEAHLNNDTCRAKQVGNDM
ncbi:MAG: hypothetical protein SGPRY_004463 [Prymnesium sp.]